MTQTRKPGWRRSVAAVGAAAAALAVAAASFALASEPPAPAAERAGGVACPTASEPAAQSTVKQLRASVRCLINEERAVHGFGKLTRSASLQRAAQRHTRAMVSTGCLSHRCPGEASLEDRLDAAGYFDGVKSWRYAENTGCGLSAEAMVANWLDSVYHRVNILDEDFRDMGVGASHRRVAGRCQKGYGTFTVVFGERSQ